jgi:hypothetical protein
MFGLLRTCALCWSVYYVQAGVMMYVVECDLNLRMYVVNENFLVY